MFLVLSPSALIRSGKHTWNEIDSEIIRVQSILVSSALPFAL